MFGAVTAAALLAVSPLAPDRPTAERRVAAPEAGQAFKSRTVSPNRQWTVFLFGLPSSRARDDTLWIQSEATLELVCLFGRECGIPDQQAWDISTPTFDEQNAEIYFSAAPENGDTPEIFAAALASQRIRAVSEGVAVTIVRDGPYQGDLIVERGDTSLTTDFLVHPDGRDLLQIPAVGPQANGEESSEAWLKAHGWQAW